MIVVTMDALPFGRGMLAGALKKKLGITITSTKSESGDRVYRVAD